MFVVIFATFLSAPGKYIQSFLNGATVWALNVLPTLFPFAVLTPLAVKCLPRTKRSITCFLFGIDADDAYLTSLLCGYPLGAKQLSELNFDKDTTTAACSFCSSASPVFIVVTVGYQLLNNTSASIALIVSHIGGTVLNGLLHRKNCKQKNNLLTKNFAADDLSKAIGSAIGSVLSVGGLIALFYFLTDIIKNLLPSNLQNHAFICFAIGLVEMTNGIIGLCNTCNTFTATVLSSFLLSFGGGCVLLQSLTFLSDKVIVRKLLLIKLTQASISALLCFVMCKFLM